MARQRVSSEMTETKVVIQIEGEKFEAFVKKRVLVERDGDNTVTTTMLFSLGGEVIAAQREIKPAEALAA